MSSPGENQPNDPPLVLQQGESSGRDPQVSPMEEIEEESATYQTEVAESLATPDRSTMASKWAKAKLPVLTDDQICEMAKKNIEKLKESSGTAYKYYLNAQTIHPHGEPTKVAFNEFKLAEAAYHDAVSAFYKIRITQQNRQFAC